MIRAVAAIALAALALTGCGGSGRSADEVLRQTAAKLGDIRSADLKLRVVLDGREARPESRLGYVLEGPIDLRGERLPIADVRYTQIAGTEEGSASFISTGSRAYVKTTEGVREIPADQVLSAGAGVRRAGRNIPIGSWMQDAERRDGAPIDDVETDRVVAHLDAPKALRDIFGALRAAGSDAPDLEGDSAEQIRKAVDEATIELWSGREDHFLRRMRLRLAFKADVPSDLRPQLGEVVGGRLSVDLELTQINRPVTVDAPS